jgi:hypothetical protein
MSYVLSTLAVDSLFWIIFKWGWIGGIGLLVLWLFYDNVIKNNDGKRKRKT